jgi:hypothetical protein
VNDINEYHEDIVELVDLTLNGFLVLMLIIVEPLFSRNTSAIITVDEGIAQRYRKLNDNVTPIFNFPVVELFNQEDYENIKNDLEIVFNDICWGPLPVEGNP